MLALAVHELLVNFVGQNHDVLAECDFTESTQLVGSVHRAGRIAGRIDDHHLGRRRHRIFKLLGGHLPTGRFLGLDKDRNTTGKTNHLGIGNPVRRRDDDLVTFFDHRKNGIEAGHFRASGHADLIGGVVEVIVLEKLGRKRFAQLGDATGRSVLGATFVERLDRGLFDEVRGINFRFATGERVHFLAFGDHGLGLRGDGQCEGGRNLCDAG